MTLATGTSLGSYEVVALIGSGGMGEVYQAHDTKLGRDVAIKVLPEAFAHDPQRLSRFQREAKLLASLNHPNIATIHGLEESNGTHYLVMELVPGETLRERVAREGALPVEEALGIAKQIAEALEAAHEKSIIHRDLKPANVKVTPEGKVKVLDFGLAKAFAGEESGSDPSNSPTLSQAATLQGVILGTAAYMSPEQARGKPVDKRTDLWAFGCVLYELLTGKQTFSGEDITEILAAVVMKEPAFDALPSSISPSIRVLLQRCLRKDRRQRISDAADVRIEIDDALTSSPSGVASATVATPRNNLLWAVAAAVAIMAVVTSWGWWRSTRPVPQPLMRIDLDLGSDAEVSATQGGLSLSPDGTRLVYSIRGSDRKLRLAVRSLDSSLATPLPGTEDAIDPFFSPDGQWIGFFAGGKLMKIGVQGGAPVTLCDVASPRGGSWGEDGEIIVATSGGTILSRVSSSGGTLSPVGQLDAKDLVWSIYPQVLPGGAAVLLTGLNQGSPRLEVQTLKTGQRKTLVGGAYFGRYTPSGHLLYVQQGTLFAASMDLKRLELTGPPSPVLENLAVDWIRAFRQFDISQTGVFVGFVGASGQGKQTLRWLDASGKPQPLSAAEPVNHVRLRLSPDGKRLALIINEGSTTNLWIRDLEAERMSRLTVQGNADSPAWAPDGGHIAYYAQVPGTSGAMYWTRSDGAGETVRLAEKPLAHPDAFSPDGKWLVYHVHGGGEVSVWTLPVDASDPEHPKPGQPQAFLQGPSTQEYAAYSPDGRWLAYKSSESGRDEVYVRPFPGPGGKWLISSGGGTYPLWSRSGHELFYLGSDQRIQVTDYTVKGDSFVAGKPRQWSAAQLALSPSLFDLMPDGKRMVMALPQEADAGKPNGHVTMMLNFFDELRRLTKP